MSATDTELRDLLEAAVGEPPCHVDVAAVHRRVRRRRWTESASVFMAFGLVAVLGVTMFAGSSGPAPLSAAAVHAGQPAYYVQQIIPRNPPMVTWVRATASGKMTATVRCPWPGATIPPQAIAPARHGVFFVACEQGKYPLQTLTPNVTGARLYSFRVTAKGKVADFSLVRSLGRYSASDVAVTPGGTEVAVALGSPHSDSTAAEGVLVIDTKTGAHAMWRMGRSPSGMVLSGAGDLSLTSNGRELAFLTDAKCPAGAAKGCTKAREVRAVSPVLTGGQLTSSRVIFRATELRGQSTGYINGALMTPDGSALTVAVIHSGRVGGTLVRVIQVSARTGKQLRVVYQVNTGNGMSYQYFSMDPTGRYMMLDAGTSSEQNNGWIYHGQLVALKPYNGDSVGWQAW